MEFFNRYGQKHEGRVHDVNEAKGTASYTYQDKCSRCGGLGYSDKWMFTGKVCFDCRGNGKGLIRTEKLYSAEKLAKLQASQAKRDAVRTAKAQAAAEAIAREADVRRAEFEAANPGLIASIDHVVAVTADPFLADMARRLREVGSLTDNQLPHAKNAVDRFQAREAAKAGSQFVSEIGKRLEFVLTLDKAVVVEFESQFGRWDYGTGRQMSVSYIHLFRDGQGNRVVYKGANRLCNDGSTIRVKATVTTHEEYKEEKQTKISRPKLIGELDAETGKFMIWDDATGSMKEVA